ncbi:helicase-exonuclease AddAB subunit AddA [Paenibacillus sp. GCM10027626]|uniref:helicase-exonuclease AddAB subunit AddA n=1 Tax=Paenibacillus sp. GCM10027626 TaxID=3273411 RepID=UPI00362C2A3F
MMSQADTLVIEKPAGSIWTDDQWKAIAAGGRNILVAAAAGSGKTAVLVERIIRKISSDTDVDRLLVATFTKAAAAEMKERIRIALEKELHKNPESEHLRKQLALMGRASITTLHSFCLDVIRKYYALVGLDPGFRIANETEAELLRMDVLDALFEERYAEAGEEGGGFAELVERYGGERGDEPLYALVMKLYDFAQSHPWPELWLQNMADSYELASADELQHTEWVRSLSGSVAMSLDGAEQLLAQAMKLAQQPDGPDAYGATFEEDLMQVRALRELVSSRPWSEWYSAFGGCAFGKLKSQKAGTADKELQEQAKELRESAKKIVADLQNGICGRPPEQFAAELKELAPLMHTLSELVAEFGRRFAAAKQEKGLLDFGDMEHYCLRILRSPDSTADQVVASAAALEYQAQFDEILLDEYQDTNMVQEAIVSLISRPGQGNRFMVGDVKQSIYRFRLAEPNLFLRKYKAYTSSFEEMQKDSPAGEHGLRIDLARNFRSRDEVVDGVNAVFRAIMRESVAELDYDRSAELVCGASYPAADDGGPAERYAVEMALLDRGSGNDDEEEKAGAGDSGEDAAAAADEEERLTAEELQTVQLEARWIAERILEMKRGDSLQPYDGKKGSKRPLAWRDIVILLRADKQWAPIMIEELQARGIPAYAELSSGYFEATEVETMLSLLRVIDNPYQDIPLAGALRSPIVGLTAEELALIRISGGRTVYFSAIRTAENDPDMPESLRGKLTAFMDKLERWRTAARQGALAELIWSVFRETGYYDFVGGMAGGLQRQANLRALYDRARQYEATSLRGLFRFLRFIERMQESGGDLGTARALGEQEDVVRIMTIHKSKGLEFPVVFVAGLGKTFNRRDLTSPFLMHKELGYGPRFVDADMRVSYPSLPFLAIKERMNMETLAEEMRILYVALTRPKEKMILVGTAADAAKQLQRWQAALDSSGQLPDFRIAKAQRFLDWLGPLAMCGHIPVTLATNAAEVEHSANVIYKPVFGQWQTGIVPAALLSREAAAAAEINEASESGFAARLALVRELIPVEENAEEQSELERRLSWRYPHFAATAMAAKTSVTEMKRLHADKLADDEQPGEQLAEAGFAAMQTGAAADWTFRLRRPKFMEERAITPAERGTISHLVMQHLPLDRDEVTEETVRQTLGILVERKMLTALQAESVQPGAIASFFKEEVGRRLLRAGWIRREAPFSCTFPASQVHSHRLGGELSPEAGSEPILVQGVIDCLFEDEDGLVLLDYKTDRIFNGRWEEAAERHRFQLTLYAEAIRHILGKQVAACYVFFFDGGKTIQLF